MDRCPHCDRPYGQRRRCYYCTSKQRTGQLIKCQECGAEKYLQLNQLENGEGKYCSYECKHKAQRGKPNHRRDEGKRLKHPNGYLLVWVGYDHPYQVRGRMLEHRYVIEQHLGRVLTPDEVVHHVNGDKTDNRIENLEVMSNADHARMHMGRRQTKE